MKRRRLLALTEARVITPTQLQHQASAVTKAAGEAYMEAVSLKGMMDAAEEIPASLRKIYNRTMSVMSQLGKAKQEAYQSEMEMRRAFR